MRLLPVFVTALVMAAPAQAAPYAFWASQSLVPPPPGVVVVVEQNCVGGADPWSCYFDGTIWLAPIHRDSEAVFLHELGHVYDERVLKSRHRRLFRRWTGAINWKDTGAELFAAAYSLCARYRVLPVDPVTQYGWAPSQDLHDRVCWLIRRVAR